jgi:hypothetical protein
LIGLTIQVQTSVLNQFRIARCCELLPRVHFDFTNRGLLIQLHLQGFLSAQ